MDLNNLSLPTDQQNELQHLLDAAHKNYMENLENLTDAATSGMEELLDRDPTLAHDLVDEYTQAASQLSNDYYDVQRELWSEYAGVNLPDFDHTTLVDTDRVLWQQQGGFNNTDFNGLTYQQVKAGQARSGMTINDLWPDLRNVDTAQQFIADMITTSTRLTTQRNMRKDPTKPHWARVADGPDPCAFCIMLAGRGFAYTSSQTADFGGSFHKGKCHCQIVASWGRNSILDSRQKTWKSMYDKSVEAAQTTNNNAVTRAMKRLYPEDVNDGIYELSTEWPKDIVSPNHTVWKHIFEQHVTAEKKNKTRFPSTLSDKKIQWAVKETAADPDIILPAGMNREYRYKMIGYDLIRVWLQKKRGKEKRFRIYAAYPTTLQEKERLWQRKSKNN